MGYKSYKDLELYQLAHKLAIEIHELSLGLPRIEWYGEGDQIRRSSKSVSANIVEGFGRKKYKNEFIKFLVYSLSSCDETKEHLELLFETKSLQDKNKFDYFLEGYTHLGKKLVNLIKAVENW